MYKMFSWMATVAPNPYITTDLMQSCRNHATSSFSLLFESVAAACVSCSSEKIRSKSKETMTLKTKST